MLTFLKKSNGILGMNSRNLNFIRPYNKKTVIKLADNKLLTKKVLKQNKIAVPHLIGKISTLEELADFDWGSLPNSFVLKPNQGLGGEGILVVFGRKKNGNWVKASREEVRPQDLKSHILNIIEGNFSLSGRADIAFFEERVQILKQLKPYSYRGVPDIRVIVFNNVPVMAMLRLPTEQSGGKANLHLGGICVGIDLARGITTSAITKNLTTQREYLLEYVPKTRLALSGIEIPFWREILEMSVKAQQVSKIGFLGIDIMLDRERGPVVAELNARPGLGIQNANLSPLKNRLQKVEGLKIKSIKKGVRLGQDLFGGEFEEDLADITGRKTLGIFETITISNPKNNRLVQIRAKIDTGAFSTSISSELAKKLGFEAIVEYFSKKEFPNLPGKESNELIAKILPDLKKQFPELETLSFIISSSGQGIRPKVKIKLTLGGQTFTSIANISNRAGLKRKAIVGRQDLKNFIIIPQRSAY